MLAHAARPRFIARYDIGVTPRLYPPYQPYPPCQPDLPHPPYLGSSVNVCAAALSTEARSYGSG